MTGVRPVPTTPRRCQGDLTSQSGLLFTRAAAAILLLYVQLVSRITRLAINDVIREGD